MLIEIQITVIFSIALICFLAGVGLAIIMAWPCLFKLHKYEVIFGEEYQPTDIEGLIKELRKRIDEEKGF